MGKVDYTPKKKSHHSTRKVICDNLELSVLVHRTNTYGYHPGQPRRLIINIQVDGRAEEIWVHQFFNKRLGRLSDEVVDRLSATMPKEAEVEVHWGASRRYPFFCLTKAELEAWLQRYWDYKDE
ncbi:MAG: hypothetical protein NTU97_02095 [Candidatus Magasanikbacteria bacterium]|nr:hypothetical protein [Candidatus Magasanikbacteria bacterium]